MFDSWLTLSGSCFDLRQTFRNLDPEVPASGRGWGRPAKFATHQDAGSRFRLGYPLSWDVHAGEGVLVRSKDLSSFAQVDVLPDSPAVWETLQAAVAKAKGSLTIQKEIAGKVRQLRGQVEFSGITFGVHAWAYPRGNEMIVLTTGSRVDSGGGPRWKLYHDQVLAAIHREFRVMGS